MRLLRLGTSDDEVQAIPIEQRTSAIAARLFSEVTGVAVEPLLKRFWPAPGFDAALDRWLQQFQPEMVYFIVPSYPVCYESVPLRFERRLGRAGRIVNTGSQLTAQSWLGSTSAFHLGRRFATRTIGGEPLLSVPQMIEYVERALKTILAFEGVIVAVRGPMTPFGIESERARSRSEGRRQALNRELAGLCQPLHVPLRLFAVPPHPAEDTAFMMGDRVHSNANEQRRHGEWEAQDLISAWEAARGPR